MLHAKIADVEDKLSRAVPIEDADIDTSKAFVGAQLRLLNKKTKKERKAAKKAKTRAVPVVGGVTKKNRRKERKHRQQ